MSVFDDQMDDWFENDCHGNIEDYDGAGNYDGDEPFEEDEK